MNVYKYELLILESKIMRVINECSNKSDLYTISPSENYKQVGRLEDI